MNLRQLLQLQEASLVESRFREVVEKRQLDLQPVHVRKDKSTMLVQVRHSLVKTLQGEFIVSVIHDVAKSSAAGPKEK